jgi:hypothetical protein
MAIEVHGNYSIGHAQKGSAQVGGDVSLQRSLFGEDCGCAELADDHELAGLVDEVDPGYPATLGMAFMLMTPLPPQDWRRYWSTSVACCSHFPK